MGIVADELIGRVQEVEEMCIIREQSCKIIIGENKNEYLCFILPYDSLHQIVKHSPSTSAPVFSNYGEKILTYSMHTLQDLLT